MITPLVIKELLDQFGSGIFQGCIAMIDSYSKSKGYAKVIPLLKKQRDADVVKFPVLSKVPILNFNAGGVRFIPDFKKGDLVWLVFSTFSIEGSLKGKFEFTDDKFDFKNCVILGGLDVSTISNNDVLEDGLVICHEKSGARIVIKEDRVKVKKGEVVGFLGPNGAGKSTLMDILAFVFPISLVPYNVL